MMQVKVPVNHQISNSLLILSIFGSGSEEKDEAIEKEAKLFSFGQKLNLGVND